MKLFKIVLMAACLSLFPSFLIAKSNTFIGTELQFVVHKSHLGNINTIHHINFFSGYKFTDNVGLEIGGYLGENHQILDYFLHKNAFHGSLTGHIPLIYGINLRLGLGSSHIVARITEEKGNQVFRRFIPHGIIGLEADLNQHMVGRFNVKFEDMSSLTKSHRAFKNDSLHFNVGIAYHF